MRILVSGATGFIGSNTVAALLERGHQVKAVSRRSPLEQGGGRQPNLETVDIEHITDQASWERSLRDVDAVVHAAGVAHNKTGGFSSEEDAFRLVNVEGSVAIARAAVRAGVRKLLFLSSIAVHGEYSTRPFVETDDFNPANAYAASKCEAELRLQEVLSGTDTELVIIRPPMVYGLNAPGNIKKLQRLIGLGIPLPLAGLHNRRSLVSVSDLAEVISSCLEKVGLGDQTFFVTDGMDYSTTDMVLLLAQHPARPIRLFKIPRSIRNSKVFKSLCGSLYNKLYNSMQVDGSSVREVLSWTPQVTLMNRLETDENIHGREGASAQVFRNS